MASGGREPALAKRLRIKRRYGNELVPATPSECGELSLAYGSASLGFLKEAFFLNLGSRGLPARTYSSSNLAGHALSATLGGLPLNL